MHLIKESSIRSVRVIELVHPTGMNPFGIQMENQVRAALQKAQEDRDVRAVVVTGGIGRSFSAGGDFNEVKALTGGDDVDAWIDRATELYLEPLKVDKPTVAAIDGYAIGMGFQFAMMFDYRIMTDGAQFRMPELKHGIGCSMGAAILTTLFGCNVSRRVVLGCENLGAPRALADGIANEVVPVSELMQRAVAVAEEMAAYPEVAFRSTKRALVAPLVKTLRETASESKRVHRAAFKAQAMAGHFRRVLGDAKFNAARTTGDASD